MKKLNTTAIYVLSVISFLCCCFAGLGIALALPAFLMANNKYKSATLHPQDYDIDDINAMKTAKTVAMIALIVNGVYLLYNIYYFATTDWSVIREQYEQMLEQYQQ